MPPPTAEIVSLARRLADTLEAAGVSYAFGGAFAYLHWGPPRATSDVDINIFLPEAGWPRALRLLQDLGVSGDPDKALAELRCRGACRLEHGDYRVDLFVPSIPFYDSVQARAVTRPLLERPARFISAEDLSVFKLLFFRPKDLVDVQYLLAAQGAGLDRAYVRRWLVDMVGEDDERTLRWDDLCREVPA